MKMVQRRQWCLLGENWRVRAANVSLKRRDRSHRRVVRGLLHWTCLLSTPARDDGIDVVSKKRPKIRGGGSEGGGVWRRVGEHPPLGHLHCLERLEERLRCIQASRAGSMRVLHC